MHALRQINKIEREMWMRRLGGVVSRSGRQLSSTATWNHPACPEKDPRALHRSLWDTGDNTPGRVTSKLDDYARDGYVLPKTILLRCVKDHRKFNRPHLALEIMKWMENRDMGFESSEHAICISLVSKTGGIAAAEEYFHGLPQAAKTRQTYGSLLFCYCMELMLDKALALFKRMDAMGFANSTLPFNNLMSMHLRLGQPQRVLELVECMKRRKVYLDTHSYHYWIQSCGKLNDLEGAERIMESMKKGDGENVKCTWVTHSFMASLYVEAGEFVRAESALAMLEAEMRVNHREAHHFLITMYARMSNLRQVHRVWHLLRSRFRSTTNISYLVLIPSLSKLNDIDGVKKWFKEWESNCGSYDRRVVNVAIKAYLDHEMYEEAVSVLEGAMKRCDHKFFRVREMFVNFLLKSHQLDPALEHLTAAFSDAEEIGVKWQLKQETLDAFLNYFKEKKDVDGAEKFCKVLKANNCLESDAYHLLLETYVAAGKVDQEMRQRLEKDSIEMNPELERLLARVCPE